ncbi:transcription and mRNA export factor SUS1-like [Populus alba x Populus x berolinensis]|nr:transcription and mRNA export factor SUS1-like [Populus alba x Populus x berolinensis]
MDSLSFFLTKLFGIILSILKSLSMSLCFRAFIKKKGKNNVTVDDLIHVITPKGRASIPDSIKAELLQRIRSFLVQAAV